MHYVNLLIILCCYKCTQDGFVGLAKAAGLRTAEASKVVRKGEVNLKAPFALIIEVITERCNIYVPLMDYVQPSRELAQQTHEQIKLFKKHLPSPGVK